MQTFQPIKGVADSRPVTSYRQTAQQWLCWAFTATMQVCLDDIDLQMILSSDVLFLFHWSLINAFAFR